MAKKPTLKDLREDFEDFRASTQAALRSMKEGVEGRCTVNERRTTNLQKLLYDALAAQSERLTKGATAPDGTVIPDPRLWACGRCSNQEVLGEMQQSIDDLEEDVANLEQRWFRSSLCDRLRWLVTGR